MGDEFKPLMCTGNPPGANVFIMMTKILGEYAQLDQNQSSTSLPFWSYCDPLWHTNRTLQFEENEEAMQWKSETLKHKCCHFDKIFITTCTGNCQNDNIHCSQWWHFHRNDIIFFTEEVSNLVCASEVRSLQSIVTYASCCLLASYRLPSHTVMENS